MVALKLRKQLRLLLEQNEIPCADFEAEQLLMWASGLERAQLLLQEDIPDSIADKAVNAARMRVKGEPLQYILGQWEFYGLPFKVGKGVLIPRQETELLAERALSGLPKNGALLDLCSGSGCIPIAVSKNSGARCCGIEISIEALRYFNENIKLNSAQEQVSAFQGDVLQPSQELLQSLPKPFDVITANPPYLTAAEMQTLQREVRHEPEEALFGGSDGLDFYRVIFGKWKRLLSPKGQFIVEAGDGQAKAVADIMKAEGFSCQTYKDSNGTKRVVAGFI